MPTPHRSAASTRFRLSLQLLAASTGVLLACGSAVLAQEHEHGGGFPSGAAQAPKEAPRGILVPPVDVGADTLDMRAYAQEQTRWQFEVFHDFKFTDHRAESGITFKHHVVHDVRDEYKPNHYDHGTGLAAADVDGDGRTDLYFVNQVGGNELWKNLGGGRFANITTTAGVALADRVSVTASFADYDNDGDADLFVTTVRMGNVLFQNDGRGTFRDVSKEAGVDHVGHSSGAVFFDYDRDGRLDLFVANIGKYTGETRGEGGYYEGYRDAFSGHLMPERTEVSILYHNAGEGRFEIANRAMGLNDRSWSGDAGVADLNRDGFPDLYVLNMQGDNHYYENEGGKRFVDKTASTFPKTPWGAMGIKFFDYDNDGDADLYLTDMHSDMSREVLPGHEKAKSLMVWTEEFLQGGANNIFGNAFYRNEGGGRFTEISDRIGAENYWPWGLSTGDLNADGYLDVFITASMNFPWRYGVNSVLLNNLGKTFLDSEFILGVEPRAGGTWRPWFEIDCSGANRNHPICRNQSGKHTVYGAAGSRSSVIFDVEGDGDLDVVTNELGDLPQILVSNLAERQSPHWLGVRLRGVRTNRDGLGAEVRVHAGGTVYTQWLDGKSGYLSQSSMPLYFGLGAATAVQKIEVLWPAGGTQTLTEGLSLGRVIEIVEK